LPSRTLRAELGPKQQSNRAANADECFDQLSCVSGDDRDGDAPITKGAVTGAIASPETQ
jgi:hypothetical protein